MKDIAICISEGSKKDLHLRKICAVDTSFAYRGAKNQGLKCDWELQKKDNTKTIIVELFLTWKQVM